ncbi:FGFR1 [Lepeophtheirus salmonis]|uniref:FGFR1 n=1 Tax=Lepeophtheirus salmonis TaxID=72036 RepID=A0A7R8D924_LEPSM|nr:FGFR1 [Lepeophtheirus salmonis]CAF3041260.1 FGFR1 [Lepeophtheirus salmonis]
MARDSNDPIKPCKLCTRDKMEHPNCYKNGIYSQLAFPSFNNSFVKDVSVLISVQKYNKSSCSVEVHNSERQTEREWTLEPFYVFGNISSPNKFNLKSKGKPPQEGTYTILFADNQSLSFDVYYPFIIDKDPIIQLNTSQNYLRIPKNIQSCLLRSKRNATDPRLITTICNEFELRPCFRNEVDISMVDKSFEFINITFNSSLILPLNVTIKCLLDAKVPMKGLDFFVEMRILYDPPNKYARMKGIRLSGYGFDVTILIISKDILILHELNLVKNWEGVCLEWLKGEKLSDGPYRKWDVAMKESSEDRDEDLLAEGKIMSVVGYHDHIVNLQCVSWNMRGNFYLILEYCHNGCIIDLLQREANNFLPQNPSNSFYSVETLLIWSRQISSGMEFLDSKNVIHGDLAGRNILLSLEYAAKISDFGLSHTLYQDFNYKKLTKMMLPIIWMGPETLKKGTITKKSDVWAFGILLWEIFTLGKRPYEGFSDEQIQAQISQGICSLQKPQLCPDDLWHLISSCWRLEPAQRPNFQYLKNTIDKLIDNGSNQQREIEEGIKSMKKRFFDNPGYMMMQV